MTQDNKFSKSYYSMCKCLKANLISFSSLYKPELILNHRDSLKCCYEKEGKWKVFFFYFLNYNVHNKILCPAVILMGRAIQREFWYIYPICAPVDTHVNFISLYIFKKISYWELISLGEVYVTRQRGKFQVVIQLSKTAFAHYGGARIL